MPARQPYFVLAAVAAAALVSALPSHASADDRVRVIVAYKPGNGAAVLAAIAKAGGRGNVDLDELDAVAVSLPRAAVAALRAHRGIDYVEDDAVRSVQGVRVGTAAAPAGTQVVPYGITLVQAQQLTGTPKWTPKICIVDSGIDATHEDLSGNVLAGKNFSGSGSWNTDEASHGTHVAGTIAALDNTLGVVGVDGRKQVSLYISKVFGASGSASASVITNAMTACGKAKANVVSMSLGGPAASKTEQRAADKLQKQGILLVAAAGNAGDTTVSYPAGFASVMSVAAVDANKQWASFSQYNSDVEIAAPGVAVLSTVPQGSQTASTLTVAGSPYATTPLEGSPRSAASGPLADFGIGDTPVAGSMAGKVCLIARGTIAFGDKVKNCQTSGGVGAVIYNNVDGDPTFTLGDTVTTIPSVGATQAAGVVLQGQLGQTAALSVFVTDDKYAVYSGTSMATPHVSSVAALVWSYYPACSAEQIRASLKKSALDTGDAGFDNKTGYGLVQARAAFDRIASLGCGQ